MPRALSFTFGSYNVDYRRSILSFTYNVELASGKVKTYTDRLYVKDVPPESWGKVPKEVLEPTLQALLLMLGINYWTVYPTSNIRIEGFTLTKEQAQFWDSLYLNGLGEYFFDMKMDFHGLIAFPYDASAVAPPATRFERPARALLLNGAGKDSILSAELLKKSGTPFDFFAFGPSLAHERIATLVGAKTISVTRRRDSRINPVALWHRVSAAYPSVSTFTFTATLLAELLGYDSIIFSNERSADIGNLTYLGLEVNHQWCKSSEAEKITNDYIQRYITPDIRTSSLLREYSELEIVSRFVQHPKYLYTVTSCNSYFCFSRLEQRFLRTPYWCRSCPKCIFLFACFAAYLPKKEVVKIFGANLYSRRRLRPLIRRILGVEGFKPLDCVGEPEEMILAMHYANRNKEYVGTPAMRLFEEYFPADYDFKKLERELFDKH
ncbi:hypothetical protein BH11PAT2_BH11PAT2_02680 [soil metagenome]